MLEVKNKTPQLIKDVIHYLQCSYLQTLYDQLKVKDKILQQDQGLTWNGKLTVVNSEHSASCSTNTVQILN